MKKNKQKSTVSFNFQLYRLFNDNLYFFIPYILFVFGGAAILIAFPKKELFLFINDRHTSFLDTFFYYMTWVGDGRFYVLAMLPLAFIKIRHSMNGLISYSLTGIFAQIIKGLYDMPRPKSYFNGVAALNFVAGVNVHSFHSFPSGHSTSAFSFFLLLSVITPYKPMGIIYFMLAVLTGLSRIYLAQHFFLDVYVGSVIGVILTTIILVTISRISRLNDYRWFNSDAVSLFKTRKLKQSTIE